MLKVTAKHIQSWTENNKKDSEVQLPQLLRRLISNLCITTGLHIPSGDNTSSPGFDGVVNIIDHNAFLPQGNCVIEIGTNIAIRQKADEDYEKRTADPGCIMAETNFIFVTSRLFSNASEWAAKRMKEGKWKSITVVNSDDLEHWLDNSPATADWFRDITKLWPSGIFSVSNAWNCFASYISKGIHESLIFTEREEQKLELLESVSKKSQVVEVVSDSQFESYGFILKTLDQDPILKEKTLVIFKQEQWDFLTSAYKDLILIPKYFIPTDIGIALTKGHTIIFPNGKEGIKGISVHSNISLPKISRDGRIKGLIEITKDKDVAEKIYAETRGYFYQILRHPLLGGTEVYNPVWLGKFDLPLLHTILFLTEWEEGKDKDLVSACLAKDYSDIQLDLELLAQCEDSPIRKIGDSVWQVVSKSDLFSLLGNNFNTTLITRYKNVVETALSDDDTSFDLPKKDRWCAAIHSKGPTYSSRIKSGISDSLALLSDIGDLKTQEYVNTIIRAIFNESKDPYKVIYNLGGNIQNVAEASPEIFLDYIEKNIDGLTGLFDQGVSDFMHSRSEHVNLMWALETLAWNTEFLPRVATILIQLSVKYENKIQPNLSNRPMGSLAEIFILWQRGTSATSDEKVAILEKIAIDYPRAVFELIIKILDSRTSSTSVKPTYRDWGELDKIGPVTSKEYYSYAIACIDILISLLKDNIENNYVPILSTINDFPIDKQNEILDLLLLNDFSSFPKNGILEARKNIRELFMREAFYDQKFLGNKDKLLTLYKTISPQDFILENEYVFNGGHGVFVIDRKDDYKKSDFDVQEKIAKEERIKAIKYIYGTLGIDGIKDLLPHLQIQGGLMDAITDSGILDEKLYDEIFNLLSEEDPSLFTFGINFLNALAKKGDINFVKSRGILEKITSEEILARFILAIDDPKDKFSILRKQTIEVQEIFWRDIQKLNWWWILREDGYSEANYVLAELNKRGLLNISFDILSRISHSKELDLIDTKIIFEIFRLLVPYINSGKHIQSIDYYLTEILQYLYALEKEGKVSANDIFGLEIQYIKTLENPIIINKTLAEKPEFLIDIIIKVYKARSEEKKIVSEEEQRIASNVFHILHNFKRIPGTQEDGSIDEKFLTDYIEKALMMLKDCDRLEIGSQKIGEVLAYSPVGKDGIWPCEAVRNVIDRFKSEQIIRGFNVGKSNLRGTTVRGMFDGGNQERELAKQYLGWAEKLKISHPFTSKALRELGKDYQHQAEREDIRVQLDTE